MNPCSSDVVADFLALGEEFSKRQDGGPVQTLQKCLLRVDTDGYFLIWSFPNQQEMNFVECCHIKEVTNAISLKDLKALYEQGGSDNSLSGRVLSVYHGLEIGNLSLTQFISSTSEQAQKWMKSLNRVVHRPELRYLSPLAIMKKQWRRLTMSLNSRGGIPVKRLVKHFGHDKNEKSVLHHLKACGFSCAKNDEILPNALTFDAYKKLVKKMVVRDDLDKVFNELAGGKDHVELAQLVTWLNAHQRDPRLNEILAPPFDEKRAMAIIEKFEGCAKNVKNRRLSRRCFYDYLASDDNSVVYPDHVTASQDMDQPLSHYFINSSHNTYLTGRQFRGKSSVDIYRHALLAGCRCVELDCWDGKGEAGEPIITHGKAMCTDVMFKSVLEAIRDAAFVTSEYPVILSFETHCSKPQQLKMARYCEEVFGDMLLSKPMDSHPLEQGVPLPSPNALKRKILIKNKRLDPEDEKGQLESLGWDKGDWNAEEEAEEAHPEDWPELAKQPESAARLPLNKTESVPLPEESLQVKSLSSRATTRSLNFDSIKMKQSVRKGGGNGDEEELELSYEYTKTSYTNIHPRLSALVNYCQSVKFPGFKKVEEDESQKYCYHMSSFSENGGLHLLKSNAIEFVNYNRSQLSRIYPRGSRVDSGNYVPQIFWNAGCHLVSLNFQTNDLGMQLNHGKFDYNRRSGYLLQPELLLRGGKDFDPFSVSTFDGVIAAQCDVQVISAQFVSDRAVTTHVEVDMYGLPNDTIRKEFRTSPAISNGLNPLYDGNFSFRKVICPDLALVRFILYDDNRQLMGQRVIPFRSLQTGYRYIPLHHGSSTPLDSTTLFVKIKLSSYVPDNLMDIAFALENPKAHQESLLKLHEKQLKRYEDDDSVDETSPRDESTSSSDSEDEVTVNHAVSVRSKQGRTAGKTGSAHGASLSKKEKKDKEDAIVQTPVTIETLESHPTYMKAMEAHRKECSKALKKTRSTAGAQEQSDHVEPGCCFARLLLGGRKKNNFHHLKEGGSPPSMCPEMRKKTLVETLADVHMEALSALKKEQEKEMSDLSQMQTKRWMENSKRISSDKKIPSAERDRRIRDLKAQNVKNFTEERKTMNKRHGKLMDRLRALQAEEEGKVMKLIEADSG